MRERLLDLAIAKLASEFSTLDLSFHAMENARPGDVTSYWPGEDGEDVMVCVFRGKEIWEPFHRQDFFFLNFAYQGSYQALSEKYNNLITIRENECYVGQPYSGYALRGKSEDELTIIGVLIRKDAFFRDYLPTVYPDGRLFRFFLEPRTNKFSEEFIHLSFGPNHPFQEVLEMMVLEYANRGQDTQKLLRSMLQTLFLYLSRRFSAANEQAKPKTLPEQILQYLSEHSDVVTLKQVADHFAYHPNYISGLLRKRTGRSFSEILLGLRMDRAALLLQNSTLSVEEIAALLGYSDKSNFHKAFRSHFGCTPREYLEERSANREENLP